MPLVSGVCRAASAPMLSHGGSRLNASKPEANPKTSCPNPGIYMHKKYLVYNELSQKNHNFFVGGKKKYRNSILFLIFSSDSKQSFTVFLCSGKFKLFFPYYRHPSFYCHFFHVRCLKKSFCNIVFTCKNKNLFTRYSPPVLFKKPKNTLQSNRLSRQKGLPTLSMARSTLKIHENFLFLNLLSKEQPLQNGYHLPKSYVNKRRQKKNIFLWRSFCFSRAKWAIKNPPVKSILGKNSAKMNIPNHSKEKTPKFCGRKEKDKNLLCFFCTYTKNPFFLLSKRPPTNDRTCMGWHTRHASIHFGAGGTFTSRDAKPNGLESCFGTSFFSLLVAFSSEKKKNIYI